MGIFHRLRLLLKSRAQREGEEAETALERMLTQIETHLAEARGQLTLCIGEEHRLSGLVAEETHCAQEMLTHARQALADGQEARAREAVARYVKARAQECRYRYAWERQQRDSTQLQQLVDTMEQKREDVDLLRRQLIVRQQLSRMRRELAETLYGEHSRLPVERAKDDVLTEELTAEAYHELIKSDPYLGLEASDTDPIEQVLRDLRGELGLPAPAETQTDEAA